MSSTDRPTKLGYSVKEAAKATTLSRSTLYAHIAAGRIKAVTIGGRKVIPSTELHALMDGGVA